ncbi:MAG: ATP-binding protein [Bacteroidia bacterium]
MKKNSFIDELLKQKGTTQIVFLRDFDAVAILQTICAFLNGDGGWILVGHNGKKLYGLPGVDDASVERLQADVYREISPMPLVYVQSETYDDQQVILINVLKGARQPYSLRGKFYVKLGSSAREANPDDISLLLRTSNGFASTWERLTAIDASMSDLVSEEIKTTITHAIQLGKGARFPETSEEFLNYFQLFDHESVKNGAIVLFGTTPAKFYGQCRIRITLMPEGRTGSRFEDTELIDDNLFTAFDRVHSYFLKNLPITSEFKANDWNRIDRSPYPINALDEAVVNAMVHRDYGDMSGEITINIHKDRIEVINSGVIPPDIIKGKSTVNAHHSILRNPIIAQMFYFRGKMEKLGRGLSLIKDRCSEYGLRDPEWTTLSGYTTLTIFGVPKSIGLHPRMSQFLREYRPGRVFTRKEYYEFHVGAISERTAIVDIASLQEGGWVDKVGDGPQTRYVRTEKSVEK